MGNPFKAIKKFFKKIVKAVVNIFSGFMGMFGMSFDTPDMGYGANYEATSQGITLNKQSNVAGIPIIYGKRKIGGIRTFVGTSGSDQKYLYVCLAVAEGEINSFQRIWINDELQSNMTLTAGGTTVSVASGSKFYVNGSARAQFQFFTGSEAGQSSSLLDEHSQWNSSFKMRGVAYVACRFEWVKPEYDNDGNQTLYNPWQGIPVIQVEIEGKKVLSGNYTSHGTTNANTYATDLSSFTYSNNPADCLLDYLRNPRYGKDLKDNRIDWSAFRASQVICDTNVNFGGNLTNNDFLDCNIFIRPEDNLFNNTKKLLQTCRGFLPYTNGKYQLKIEAGETRPDQLLEITDDMIIGNISIQSADKNSKYNEARITYNNYEKNYESDTAIYTDDAYKTTDGEDLVLQIGAPGITARERALQYAEYLVQRSRKQLMVSLTMTSEGQQLVAGDLCTLTHKYSTGSASSSSINDYMFYGTNVLQWNGSANVLSSYSDPSKIFRVTSIKLNYDGTVDLTLLEHQNDIYDVRVQSEDTDLSAYNNPPITPGKPAPPSKPSVKTFTVSGQNATIFGKAGVSLFINNNNYQNTDGNAVAVKYQLTLGSNVASYTVALPNAYGSGFTNVNGTFFKFQDIVTVNISSIYPNGQINPIETHTITLPANPNAVAQGTI